MKTLTTAILFIFLWFMMIYLNDQRPTRAEIKAMIKGNTTSIFHINNAGRLESCLYTLIDIEHIQITKPQLWRLRLWKLRRRLERHLRWLADREEQRQDAARDKFNDQ